MDSATGHGGLSQTCGVFHQEVLPWRFVTNMWSICHQEVLPWKFCHTHVEYLQWNILQINLRDNDVLRTKIHITPNEFYISWGRLCLRMGHQLPVLHFSPWRSSWTLFFLAIDRSEGPHWSMLIYSTLYTWLVWLIWFISMVCSLICCRFWMIRVTTCESVCPSDVTVMGTRDASICVSQDAVPNTNIHIRISVQVNYPGATEGAM